MVFLERTVEFNRCVELLSEGQVVPVVGAQLRVSGLMMQAKDISKSMNFVRDQLEKLFAVVHKQGTFDNSSKHVNELTTLCKTRLEAISQDLTNLQTQGTSRANSSTAAHFKILVETLRRTLNEHGKNFKEALEVRSASIKRQHERRKQFTSAAPTIGVSSNASQAASTRPRAKVPVAGTNMHLSSQGGGGLRQRQGMGATASGNATGAAHPRSQDSWDQQRHVTNNKKNDDAPQGSRHNPYRRLPSNPYARGASTTAAFNAGVSTNGFQAQQFYAANDTSLRRTEAIQAAKQVAAISSMWTQMTSLISEADDMLPSIEQDVFQAETHISSGQNELLKYWKNVAGERALILKLFGVLLVIIFVFTYMRS